MSETARSQHGEPLPEKSVDMMVWQALNPVEQDIMAYFGLTSVISLSEEEMLEVFTEAGGLYIPTTDVQAGLDTLVEKRVLVKFSDGMQPRYNVTEETRRFIKEDAASRLK